MVFKGENLPKATVDRRFDEFKSGRVTLADEELRGISHSQSEREYTIGGGGAAVRVWAAIDFKRARGECVDACSSAGSSAPAPRAPPAPARLNPHPDTPHPLPLLPSFPRQRNPYYLYPTLLRLYWGRHGNEQACRMQSSKRKTIVKLT
ncbi:hypothetical protein EVAR_7647_1 [Eumeta japonica]|uniref:Uncharacterized protein n=1 Tax=Eumeta variegata TaxID=151549 RepID=A0A4C1TLP1_EUMVA|nr:hypothetical protein EVAR_7647_1 [Eumeta japonica]